MSTATCRRITPVALHVRRFVARHEALQLNTLSSHSRKSRRSFCSGEVCIRREVDGAGFPAGRYRTPTPGL